MNYLVDSFSYTQSVLSDTWTVSHGFNRPVNATVQVKIGTELKQIEPKQIKAVDANTLVITFSQPYTGTVRVF